MSRPKELDFFVSGGPRANWSRGISWYRSQFPPNTRVRGESSPRYTMYPFYPDVPERMSSLIPDAKLIYLIRDPIERIFSHYLHEYGHKYSGVGLAELLSDFEASRFVQASRYFLQLERYLCYFPSSSILIVPQEELKESRAETLRRIFRFLGVDENFTSPAFLQLRRESRQRRQKTRAGAFVEQALTQLVGKDEAVRRLGTAPRLLKIPFTRPYERPALDARRHAELVEYLKPDADRLRVHTGLALERWSV